MQQAGKFEASAHAPELSYFLGQLLLLNNPFGINRRSKRGNPRLAQRRRSVSAQQFAQSVKLQHPCGVMHEQLKHRSLCYRNDKIGLFYDCAAASAWGPVWLATGRRSMNIAPPSGLFWQVICPQ